MSRAWVGCPAVLVNSDYASTIGAAMCRTPSPDDDRCMNRGIRKLIISALVVVAAVLAPGAAASPAGAAGATASTITVRTATSTTYVVKSTLETAVITLTNTRRALAGCAPLRLNTDLRYAARKHSRYMAVYQTMSHQLPGEPTLGRRITLAGYTGWSRVAENVAAGYSSATTVVRAWMASYGHRRNINDCSLREIGVGVVLRGTRLYWTQNFGRR